MRFIGLSTDLQSEILALAQRNNQSMDDFVNRLLMARAKNDKIIDEALYFAAQKGWESNNEDFFHTLTHFLTKILSVDYAIIDAITDETLQQAQVLSFRADGTLLEASTYELAGTPCDNVVHKGLCVYDRNIRQLFPQDKVLVTIQAESYIGIPLWGTNGKPIGLIAVMSREPITQSAIISAVLQIVAVRAAHEIERKQHDTKQREIEQLMISTLNGLSAHIAIVDTDGTILATNQAWKQFAAANDATDNVSEQANYLAVCDTATGNDAETARQVAAAIRAVLRGEVNNFYIEYPCHAPHEKRWFICRVTPLSDSVKPRAIVAHENITERKLMELELRATEQRYRAIFEQAADGIIIVDPETSKIVASNDAAFSNLGYSRDEFEQLCILDIEAIESETEIAEHAAKFKTGDTTSFETKHRHKDGSIRDVWVSSRYVEIEQQQPFFISILRDTTDVKAVQRELHQYQHHLESLVHQRTAEVEAINIRLIQEIQERKNTEAVLQAEKQQKELILNNVADAVMFASPDGLLLYVNPAWERLTGYSSAEAIGQNPRLLASGRTPKSTFVDMWDTILAGEVWSGILFNKTKNGVLFDVLCTIVPIVDENGVVQNFVGVHRDVTQERQLAAMKEAFIANAAHDLSNPVAVLQTSLHLLQNNPAQLDKRLTIIKSQTDRLTALIRDLLTVSRLDRQVMLPEFGLTNINDLIQTVIDAQYTLAEERNQILEFIAYPDLPDTLVDAEQIERVIVNLLANAMNYTQQGGQIIVRTELSEPYILITIQDNGIGITVADIPRVFDRFFRSDNARSTANGTGLGLSIVREIIKLHHGQVHLESELNKGTTVYVRIPV